MTEDIITFIPLIIASIPGIVAAIAVYQNRQTHEKQVKIQHYQIAENLDKEFREIENAWVSLLLEVDNFRNEVKVKNELLPILKELARKHKVELEQSMKSKLDEIIGEELLTFSQVVIKESLYAWDMLRFLDKVAYYANEKKIDREIALFYTPSFSEAYGRLEINDKKEEIKIGIPNFLKWINDNQIQPMDKTKIKQISKYYQSGSLT